MRGSVPNAEIRQRARAVDAHLRKQIPQAEACAGLPAHEIAFYEHCARPAMAAVMPESRSQLLQDLWVAYLLGAEHASTQPGFFVEFGAYDGVTLSNTWMLERALGWRGILAEPIPEQVSQCRATRGCIVDDRCVFSASGSIVEFNVVEGLNELGTIAVLDDQDQYGPMRRAREKLIEVETVSLADLLRQHEAPRVIDYLSIDTEGSELEILRAFPFDEFEFKTLTVEHNYSAQRAPIESLLARHGYRPLPRSGDYWDEMFLNTRYFSGYHPSVASDRG